MPFLFLLYIVNYIDRNNVGFAGLQMTGELRFSDAAFGLGSGIFFIGYVLLGIPGAMIVEKWSARKIMAAIMIAVLRDAVQPGRGGGGLLPRHHYLYRPLASRHRPGQSGGDVHGGDSRVPGDRRSALGRTHARSLAGSGGLALAAHSRRRAGGFVRLPVGSEVAHKVALTLATVRHSNVVCGFPAPRFHEDTNYEIR
jgi:hypothetical protein